MPSSALVASALFALTSAMALPQGGSIGLPCGANSTVVYSTVAGDTLGSLATKFNSGICDIASLNNISNPNLVAPGQALKISTGCTTADNTSCLREPASATTPPALSSSALSMSLRAATLSKIASNYNITLKALVNANKQIENIDLIFPNQLINVPVCAGSQCLVKTYSIKSSDLFFDLAANYGTTVGNIEGVNANVDPTKLAVGRTILLTTHCKIAGLNETD